ncbi:cob(I)yrinic acid a,c-diamide adenosyltransferase [Acetobacter sp.]|jgi:cob(I)alamin adenosyltransferase|uniref:cob(I)yrinic acid a,c-diamide adenosyltransferase n=1 Tax=Acetobacter sp. TaxID=440 RepID=UPI0025C58E75|nr:cob(I)yrinic acid a,c-diamide adenosyltransferase [Acetobacter sp.]MCH4092216.1 cob(I)yrinic acid a,c-diamide adenosyltransferase [Acetobacter sp.]MCI1299867.1 cob(I)yrinic acid a,c-diamide adenosyltransferase [Acetobacter sp.]MCI1315885.1 cob(I)yrinic acid a,c-diamide adenosyltransferase [Acetobacter sp.]
MSVRIDRVVTRGGDKGQTSLGDGTRLSKADLHVEAIGVLDEANAAVGVLRSHVVDPDLSGKLMAVQNLLFDMGGDLCMPEGSKHAKRLTDSVIVPLEAEIERLRVLQVPLTSFILPGGSVSAAWAHIARTAVRKAERAVVALSGQTTINPVLMPLLNRLSDYFFVLGRHLNDDGRQDVLWQPGATLFADTH